MAKSKKQRREEAAARQESYDALTPKQKIAKARGQMGDSQKVLNKLKGGA